LGAEGKEVRVRGGKKFGERKEKAIGVSKIKENQERVTGERCGRRMEEWVV